MRYRKSALLLLLAWSIFAPILAAQSGGTGSLDLTAQMTPTGGRPEPVREFTFYVLTKSYAEIIKEVEAENVLPTREQFIENLKVTPELKTWMKDHDIIDLTQPDIDKLITADDILLIPEFLAAYQRSNSGGVTSGLPDPKFKDTDKEANPDKYAKQKQEYATALKKFIQSHQSTISGIELELAAVNPKVQWDKLQVDHRKKIAQLAPDLAQTKYLAGKTDTDLDGRAHLSGIFTGSYWVSSLGMDAASGDRRLHWDVPMKISAGQTTRLALTNVNGTDANAANP
jgi:hypothetical protein